MKDIGSNMLKKDLEPILAMLEDASRSLTPELLQQKITFTIERVAAAPEQYLSGNLKPTPELQQAIQEIFLQRLN